MFLQVSVIHSVHRGGACVVLFGGGVRGFIRRGVRGFTGGHAWFYSGGHAWFYSGGRVWFYLGGWVWFYSGGACVVLFGGHAWFYSEGACMVLFRGGVRGFFSFFGYNEIRSMSGRYASYWNAFLFKHRIVLIFPSQYAKQSHPVRSGSRILHRRGHRSSGVLGGYDFTKCPKKLRNIEL